MYKPNFCAECGVRVERVRWRVWTSRRFCSSCDRRFRRRKFVVPLVLGAGLFAFGFISGRAGRPAPSPLVVERGEMRPAPLVAPQSVALKKEDDKTPVRTEPRYGPDGTANERPTDPEEIVSICGARTKKGTPCQRRVRGTGRCWQHRGKAAMLPPSKLILPG